MCYVIKDTDIYICYWRRKDINIGTADHSKIIIVCNHSIIMVKIIIIK